MREGRSRCCRRHRAARAKTRGKGWQGDDVDDDGGRGNRVFVVVVIVGDFRGATPTWRWGGRAVAGMLRRVALLWWRWSGGGKGERRAGLEGDGPNNQHNVVNRARKKLIIKLIDFILVFYPHSQLERPQNDGIALPPQSPPRRISSPPFPPSSRPRTFGWLLCFDVDFWPPSPRRIFFSHQFSSINSTAKAMTRRPPARSAPVVSPLRCTSHR